MADDPKPSYKSGEVLGGLAIIGGLLAYRDQLTGLPTEVLWAIVMIALAIILSRTAIKVASLWHGGQTVIYEADPDVKALGEEVRKLRK